MSSAGVAHFDPLAPEIVEDPWPLHRRLRDDDPVHEGADGVWWVSRHADVVKVLRDRRMSRRAPGTPTGEQHWDEAPVVVFGKAMMSLDPPDHTRIRALATRNLSAAPDELDLTRRPNRHVAFGNGPHLCPGALASRVEAQLALPPLVTALGEAELLEEPCWRHSLGLSGLTALRLQP